MREGEKWLPIPLFEGCIRQLSCILDTFRFFPPPRTWWSPSRYSTWPSYANDRVINFPPKYELSVRVANETGVPLFLIFDKEASKLIGKPCSELLKMCFEGSASYGLPDEISSLIGKTFLFKVKVKNSTTKGFEPMYRVKNICGDAQFMEKFIMMNKNFNVRIAINLSNSAPKMLDEESVGESM